MSKITFRADDDLVARLEGRDASKSEVMREALRAYLDEGSDAPAPSASAEPTASDAGLDRAALDALVRERVDAILAERSDDLVAEIADAVLAEVRAGGGYDGRPADTRDVTLTINVDGATAVDDRKTRDAGRTTERETEAERPARGRERDAHDTKAEPTRASEGRSDPTCGQCGEGLSSSHVFCPNCGEKANHRVFCDCGDEVRSDWSFCPGCGRRTPAADVLDRQ
ncbi:double zinc ribbon domain-containing protein [Halomarina ordinaria]|uniref:Zinc ribbon domain-containing protein n=1 Tax=Halomarina ordinaria TaxID=3033939 RepID=A0ABD5U8F3_9EURY|nr:zinc ribbon domain-containing protein [Halomarina sp. PSRA2]